MAAPKGHPKYGGRKRGACNRITKDARAFIGQLLDSQRVTLFDDFAAVEPYQRLTLFERLLAYVCPKIKEQDDRQLSPIEEFFQHRLEQVKNPVAYDDSDEADDDDGNEPDDG